MSAKNIVWLASYPKSGNTWIRALLMNYALNADKPVPINQMHTFSMGDAIPKTYEMVNRGPINGLNEQAILTLRAKVLNGIAGNGADVNLVKTHNVNDTVNGVRLIPPHFTKLAVYVLRNPLDMAVSFARHFAMPLDRVAIGVGSRSNKVTGDATAVTQYISSWSHHVDSWVKSKAFPVQVIRYEDMLTKPAETFAPLVKRIGLPLDPARLDKAIEFSSFKELKRQEKTYGFIEQSANGSTFFHKGTAEQWKEELSADQAARIRQDNGKVMQRYGYF